MKSRILFPAVLPPSTFRLTLSAISSVCLLAASAQAALTITNGDFESGIADQSTPENVAGWFDMNNGQANFFQHTWHDSRDAEVPTDAASGFSGQAAAAFSGIAGGGQPAGLAGSWLYQSIGSDASATSFDIIFDWGDFANINGNLRDLGITVSVYQSNGAFGAADSVDINGGGGVTLLDSQSFSLAKLAVSGAAKLSLNEIANFDISGQTGGGELFLRFNNWDGGADTPWLMLDNVEITNIVPEPTVALLGGIGLLGMLRRRRA
jgi:hypothetical protein